MIGLREPGDEVLPGYELITPIGSGGFGEVWKCTAPGGLHKAIKFVFGNLDSMDGDSAKAEQELKALGRMKEVRHPFVVSIERIDNISGELLILMELAEKSLHDCFMERVERGEPGIPRDLLLGYLADAAEGLDFLIEKHNLQHLDVKPKNLFLVGDRVKVADFGLVKHLERHSSSGLMAGVTPVYAAPETFANKISKHSDQYSLAVVYVDLLTGTKPFNGKNIRQLALQHMSEKPDLSMLPTLDRPVVERALAKNPTERFSSCCEFINALIAISVDASGTNLRTSRPSVSQSVRPRSQSDTPPPSVPISNLSHHDPAPTNTITRFEQGILRPSILIGVGGFGRRALQQLRCRLLDRVGDLHQVPSFRFLYLDIDPDSVNKLIADRSDAALLPEQLVTLPLQPVNNYRRKHLDPILEWMPREKLYAMPRSLQPDGSRALGRLAFCDHYLKVMARLKSEFQIAIHPEAVKQSADQTGLTPRSKTPSVYVFISAAGGSSGFLLDLGHSIRRLLKKFNMPDALVTAFIFCSSPEDACSPPQELANIYATLAELNHYSDPDVPFTAQYSGDSGPKIESHGLPFTATYLLPMSQRTPEAYRDTISHLSGYLTHELTSPLGTGLEEFRNRTPPLGRTPFRGFGTFGVWFPRGLLLRSAARQLCTELLKNWSAAYHNELPTEAKLVVEDIYSDPRLLPEEIHQFLHKESLSRQSGLPYETANKWLVEVTDQLEIAAKKNDAANWSTTVWEQMRELIGLEPTIETDSPYRRGRISRMLDRGIASSTKAWENEFIELFRPVYQIRGPRLYAAAASLEKVILALNSAAITQEDKIVAMADRRFKAFEAAEYALKQCQIENTGFKLFGNQSAKQLKALLIKIKQFIDIRFEEDLINAAGRFYRKVALKLEDQLRNVLVARDQLDAMLKSLSNPTHNDPGSRFGFPNFVGTNDYPEESVQASFQLSNTMRMVLPNGDDQIDHASAELLKTVPEDRLQQLFLMLDKLIIEPRGGLVDLCKTNSDLYRSLLLPMIEQSAAFLSNVLPAQDVTEVELASQSSKKGNLTERIQHYLKLAIPELPGPNQEEKTFVLVPSTSGGNLFANAVRQVLPKSITVSVQGQITDLLFCREQGALRPADLMKVIEPCWDAYHEAAESVDRSPHSRFDVLQWSPLEEQ